MENAILLWKQLEGADSLQPPWTDKETRTIRFSNTVARELATLITQEIDIKVQSQYGTGEKAQFLQDAIDKHFLMNAQDNIEKMIRLGGIMAKWNGEGIDYFPPDRFLVTEFDSNKQITAAVFFSYYNEKDKFYTRAEWHRFETVNRTNEETKETETVKLYKISNKAYMSDNVDDIGREISLKETKWADIEPETALENLEKPLFAYLKCPYSNTIDTDSPLGVSLFSECIEELRWLDVAMSSMGTEVETSSPIMFVDNSALQYATNNGIKLPKFVKGLDMGIQPDGVVAQWQPQLQVTSRTDGINFYLSIISYKCGFDPGYFVFNGQTISIATATQVESTERRTINTVLSYRSLLDRPKSNGDGRVGFVHDIAYIIDTMATLSGDTELGDYGNYEIFCDFADLTENREENKAFDFQLAQQGYMSKVRFLIRNLGLTEEEATAMVQEAQAEQKAENELNSSSLFSEE
jgi:A118 family predicted phage portal protein